MNGCWVLYYDTAVAAYDTEIEALREAVAKHASVKFVPFGMPFLEAFATSETWEPEDDEPIPFIPALPEAEQARITEEDIMRRITLPENNEMRPL